MSPIIKPSIITVVADINNRMATILPQNLAFFGDLWFGGPSGNISSAERRHLSVHVKGGGSLFHQHPALNSIAIPGIKFRKKQMLHKNDSPHR
ncbi:hypothetical protein AB833_31505 [Chromatiales bacterium (ex Bugula neritina AB1)]|nr:hypothetical protein AB833_31505 [Chromatiales bacterium (ex Bugula neritina AB1)]